MKDKNKMKKELKKGLLWLFHLYDGVHFDDVDVEGLDAEDRQEEYEMRGKNRMLFLSAGDISSAIIRRLETAYVFEISAEPDMEMDYKGSRLFPEKACRIYTEFSSGVYDAVDKSCYHELWIMTDGKFAVVENIELKSGLEGRTCIVSYRKKIRDVAGADDLQYFDGDYLWGQFYNMQNGYPDFAEF
nr:hypothetical protein [uncultured Acetatifactor sp.]